MASYGECQGIKLRLEGEEYCVNLTGSSPVVYSSGVMNREKAAQLEYV